MGNFGCVDYCMNDNQGRWIIIILLLMLDLFDNQGGGGVIRMLPFDYHISNDQEGGWILLLLIIIMLSLFTVLLDWIGNQNKWRLAIWYHYFILMGSNVGKHKLFVTVLIITLIFAFVGSNISM